MMQRPPRKPAMRDYYSDLMIFTSASQEQIQQMFIRRGQLAHPDERPPIHTGAGYQRLRAAYDVLHDKDKRREYDLFHSRIRAQWDEYSREMRHWHNRQQNPDADEQLDKTNDQDEPEDAIENPVTQSALYTQSRKHTSAQTKTQTQSQAQTWAEVCKRGQEQARIAATKKAAQRFDWLALASLDSDPWGNGICTLPGGKRCNDWIEEQKQLWLQEEKQRNKQ